MRLFDLDRAMRLMKKARIDCILASTRHNVGYLSDYWHAVSDDFYLLWDTSVTHKTFCGIPRDPAKRAFLVVGARS